MFDTYGSGLKFHFAATDRASLANIERAIYEVTMPEFNLLAPPQT